jgi:hypothetical protein
MLDPRAHVCEMRWYELAVSTGSSAYITSMSVTIDGKQRAMYTGFFQTSMNVPFGMHPASFEVDCGQIGSGGDPERGMAHTYQIRAFDSTGLLASNSGTTLCPSNLLFADGFEGGSPAAWSSHVP